MSSASSGIREFCADDCARQAATIINTPRSLAWLPCEDRRGCSLYRSKFACRRPVGSLALYARPKGYWGLSVCPAASESICTKRARRGHDPGSTEAEAARAGVYIACLMTQRDRGVVVDAVAAESGSSSARFRQQAVILKRAQDMTRSGETLSGYPASEIASPAGAAAISS